LAQGDDVDEKVSINPSDCAGTCIGGFLCDAINAHNKKKYYL
jgi:poly(3-hydroxyalkanoate) synthetase